MCPPNPFDRHTPQKSHSLRSARSPQEDERWRSKNVRPLSGATGLTRQPVGSDQHPFPVDPIANRVYRPRKPNDSAEAYCLWRLGKQRDLLRDAVSGLRPTDPEFGLISERLARAEHAFDLQADEVLQTVAP